MGNRLFKSVRGERKEPIVYGIRYLPDGKTVPKYTSKLTVKAEDVVVGPEGEGLCSQGLLGQTIPSSPPTTPDGEDPWNSWQGYDYDLENVVMSGGGSKGYAYIGALKVMFYHFA